MRVVVGDVGRAVRVNGIPGAGQGGTGHEEGLYSPLVCIDSVPTVWQDTQPTLVPCHPVLLKTTIK